jgi:DNA-directed RNA polymerase specialized sigma24 family protein
MSPNALDTLEIDWPHELNRPLLHSRFRARQAADPALSRFADLTALVRFMHKAKGAGAEKDRVLCALLVWAQQDPLGGRVVLETIRPGLLRLAGRLIVDADDQDELLAVLLGVVWEQIRGYPVERRPRWVAANLLMDTLNQTQRALHPRHRRVHMVPCGLDIDPAHGDLPPANRPSDEGDVDGLLGRAVRAGALARQEAQIILRSRIDGVSVEELARAAGVSYNTMKLRRQRAERRLLVFLGHRPVPRGQQNRPLSSARVVRRRA